MLKAVSTYVYVKERLHPGILDGLARSGVQAIEIFAARQHLDYANRKAHVKEIAEWFRGSGVPLNSVHSPLYADYEWGRAGAPPLNLASTDRAGLVQAMDEVKRALEIAEIASIEALDLFRGKGVPEGHHSLLIRVTFQSYDATLTDAQMAEASARIVRALESLGAKLRAS